ncbi:unnamed protein product [Brassica oleracea]|uniref:(rape) hypothetical protein n=1 Tax=Brassica napus TaxID=3708 RepID=A0A816PYY0_BRANA|nr:unnamed protein product [Brassica napus]
MTRLLMALYLSYVVMLSVFVIPLIMSLESSVSL